MFLPDTQETINDPVKREDRRTNNKPNKNREGSEKPNAAPKLPNQPNMATKNKSDEYMGMNNNKRTDLTGKGVPEYNEDAVEEQDVSLKEMIAEMRARFLTVG